MGTLSSHRAAFLWLTLAGASVLYACAAPATTPAPTPTAPVTETAVAGVAVTPTPAATAAMPMTAMPMGSPSAMMPSGAAATGTPAGNAAAGVAAMERFNCGSCHTIPGVPRANGTSAPSLAHFGSMAQILGRVPNTPANTASFIENPQQMVPGSSMPSLSVPAQDAQNMAAFLETLK